MNPKLGYVLVVIGFIILVANAIDYISGFFGLSLGLKTVSSVVGIALFVIGAGLAKKSK